MKFQKLRKIHLYLGCFFAPLIILFIISGVVQTLWLHHNKDEIVNIETGETETTYNVPKIVKIISTMHTQRSYKAEKFDTNQTYKYFVLAMAAGLILTIVIGVVMAFRFENAMIVLILLLLGIMTPIGMVLIK